MKIQLLGTGAADGIPGLFSKDRVSSYARAHRGKDVRTRSSALVDDCLKIDFPPETLCQAERYGHCALDWCAVLFTHDHADHLAIDELQYALFPFTELEETPFVIYANEKICQSIETQYPDWPIELVRLSSFETVSIGEYQVTPIHAFHDLEQDSHNLVVRDTDSCLLYATDTGVWRDETWEYLQSVRLDALVIECTEGFVPTDYWGHLDIHDCVMVVERLREMGTLKPNAPIITTHHSHNGNATHQELEEALLPHQITPGYDGIVLEF